jgi:hypothetical protein
MNRKMLRRAASAGLVGLFALVSTGCAVTGDGYGYDNGLNVGIGLGYYQPYNSYYGGWDSGYRVAPYRGGGNYRPDRGPRSVPHSFRPAPGTRPVPSIPGNRRPGRLLPR